MIKEIDPKTFVMNILNGVATGVVVVLIPGALLSELFKALVGVLPQLTVVLNALNMSNSLMGVVCGISIGMRFGFTPIESFSLGLATHLASGSVIFKNGSMVMNGTGDIINMIVTATVGALVILLLKDKLKSFSLLVIPPLLLAVIGVGGLLLYPYVSQITAWIGIGVKHLTALQPGLMSILLAEVFALLILSPITTVGIALAVSLSGLGSGAANLGICAAGFGYAIMGWNVNPHGTSLAMFMGSPKMALPLVVRNFKTFIPIAADASVLGLLAYIFNIQGTPMSAGFGISGLVGPLNHINLASGGWNIINVIVALMVFIVAPIGLAFLFKYLFTKVFPLVQENDYQLEM
ncbi:PTS transporter subunit IIC [Ligilactobacillus pobuzihii]|uniref:Phosphotransferase system EIIC domain-containing protein n=1 Tax=Ligilactobacillus pobuzihii TaxID=449659 RepID=A0A0R2L8V6_9LACO|nr:PTS sugar transporter subunit IIC [Ligilactobacillus pobuzihii]KRK09152.1 hypothetical protein FD11_GL001169 [Ligilactobacillus pobuzihii E100301 = KCTC 13174]KRN95820.1 hypothetical protein IV66_GL000842 [Ligilactobacillus pobuzihii]GEN49183.1 membrane protein [Ligilactobacillus pobuzihii]